MMEEIKNSLSSNTFLTEDIKEDISELIIIFIDKFPDVDLTNLNERLKTLKVNNGSKFVMRAASKYYPENNEIMISKKSITDNDMDCKHILMRELLNVISAKDNFTGFNKNSMFEAFNVGYTEMLATFLVGSEYDLEHEKELIAADLVMQMIDNDTMQKAYFGNDVSLILNEIGPDLMEEIMIIMQILNASMGIGKRSPLTAHTAKTLPVIEIRKGSQEAMEAANRVPPEESLQEDSPGLNQVVTSFKEIMLQKINSMSMGTKEKQPVHAISGMNKMLEDNVIPIEEPIVNNKIVA